MQRRRAGVEGIADIWLTTRLKKRDFREIRMSIVRAARNVPSNVRTTRTIRTFLFLRRQPNDSARRRGRGAAPSLWIGQHIQVAVRSLHHVADALFVLLQEALLADHLLAFDHEAYQRVAAESADEEAAFPRRESVAGVERHPARRDIRIPVVDRLLHPGFHLLIAGDAAALVLDTVRDGRPAVVLALARDVDLVTPVGAVLDFPQLAGRRVQRC